jgi:signal transduction histidine kinase
MTDKHNSLALLLAELDNLRNRLSELEAAARDRESLEEQLRVVKRELRERIKEINCLHSISKLRDRLGIPGDEMLQGIVDLIPAAWQYPKTTCARLTLPERRFQTSSFLETSWRQCCEVRVGGEPVGKLEVFYTESKPSEDEGPFLKEERNLLEAVSERVGKILELERAEEEARRQREQVIQLDKMAALGTMISGVAHEINNPNNFIMLNTPVLQEAFRDVLPVLDDYHRDNGEYAVAGIPYSEMRENFPVLFSGVIEGAKRIRNIVNGLKDFARADTHDMTESVDVNAVVKSAITLLGNHIRISTKHFSVRYGEGLPRVRGNFQRLEQVVINLVQNACEALSDNQRGVEVATRYEPAGNVVTVEVRDEGVGIPPDRLPHIMDPFNTTKRDKGGVGLGLSVSSGIVKDHGGVLVFSSEPGRGTVATLSLPLVESEDNPEEGGR